MLFDLRFEPWVPVLSVDGSPARVGVVDALVRSHDFASLACEVSTLVPAVLRHVLVPIVMDVLRLRDAVEWAGVFVRGRFSDEESASIVAYLERHSGRFDLFDPVQPFGQVGGLHTESDTTRSVSVLVPHEPAGSVVPIFSDARPLSVSAADAALWMLHAHCWDVGAIKTGAAGDPMARKGKTMGNPVGPLGSIGVVVPVGRTLFETIMLNTPFMDSEASAADVPPWRREPGTAAWSKRAATGMIDLLTWQARRIRLVPDRATSGLEVSRVVLAGGDRLEEVPEFEPHTSWRRKSANGRDPWYPARHRPGRRGWQGLVALLTVDRAQRGPGDGGVGEDERLFRSSALLGRLSDQRMAHALGPSYPLTVLLCALHYNSKFSGIVGSYTDSVPVSTGALLSGPSRDAVLEIGSLTDSVGKALRLAQASLREAVGLAPLPYGSDQLVDARFNFSIDPAVRGTLRKLSAADDDPDEIDRCLAEWELVAFDRASSIARDLFTGTPIASCRIRHSSGFTHTYGKTVVMFRKRIRDTLTRAAAIKAATRKD